MTRRGRRSRLAAVLASAALSLPLAIAAAGAHADARPARLTASSVSMSVEDLQPTVLPTDAKVHPLDVTLTVTNRTDRPLKGVTVEGERGEPLQSQTQLDDVIKHVAPPAGHVVPIQPTTPVRLDLDPGTSQEVVFHSTTSTTGDVGLCNCTNGDLPALIYPLYFSVHVKGSGGVDQQLGLTSTFVSAFQKAPAPVRVSWVWPLIDQPHLLSDTAVGTGGPVFADDALAASVSSGGRLDRALAVVEAVAEAPAKIPLTLVVDPELLDELQLMATGQYQVRTGTNTYAAGLGGAAATSWLLRLRQVLDAAPALRLQFTPYADPDVGSLVANGLPWANTLPATMRARVEEAIGRSVPVTTLAWPAAGALARPTLTELVRRGTSTVLLNTSAVTVPRAGAGPVRPGLARLFASGEDVGVGLLDPILQRYAQRGVTRNAVGTTVLPVLTSELTIRAVAEPSAEHVAVLAPPRWVDADVDSAVRVIEATSRSLATAPLSLADAVGGELLPNGRSHLAAMPASAATLPSSALEAIRQVGTDEPALRAILTPLPPGQIDPRAQALLDDLPLEAQRVASAAWGQKNNDEPGRAFARELTDQLDGLTQGVRIVTPSSGSYTLASDNSPLPITVRNDLPYPVRVQVRVSPLNGQPGFSAEPQTQVVGAHQKATLHLATSVDRTGRIRVLAALYTPDGAQRIGDSQAITVRSTALGVIGVIITIGAGTVLVLALLIRFGRRLRRRWRRSGQPRPRWDPDAPDAEQTFAEQVQQRPAERTP